MSTSKDNATNTSHILHSFQQSSCYNTTPNSAPNLVPEAKISTLCPFCQPEYESLMRYGLEEEIDEEEMISDNINAFSHIHSSLVELISYNPINLQTNRYNIDLSSIKSNNIVHDINTSIKNNSPLVKNQPLTSQQQHYLNRIKAAFKEHTHEKQTTSSSLGQFYPSCQPLPQQEQEQAIQQRYENRSLTSAAKNPLTTPTQTLHPSPNDTINNDEELITQRIAPNPAHHNSTDTSNSSQIIGSLTQFHHQPCGCFKCIDLLTALIATATPLHQLPISPHTDITDYQHQYTPGQTHWTWFYNQKSALNYLEAIYTTTQSNVKNVIGYSIATQLGNTHYPYKRNKPLSDKIIVKVKSSNNSSIPVMQGVNLNTQLLNSCNTIEISTTDPRRPASNPSTSEFTPISHEPVFFNDIITSQAQSLIKLATIRRFQQQYGPQTNPFRPQIDILTAMDPLYTYISSNTLFSQLYHIIIFLTTLLPHHSTNINSNSTNTNHSKFSIHTVQPNILSQTIHNGQQQYMLSNNIHNMNRNSVLFYSMSLYTLFQYIYDIDQVQPRSETCPDLKPDVDIYISNISLLFKTLQLTPPLSQLCKLVSSLITMNFETYMQHPTHFHPQNNNSRSKNVQNLPPFYFTKLFQTYTSANDELRKIISASQPSQTNPTYLANQSTFPSLISKLYLPPLHYLFTLETNTTGARRYVCTDIFNFLSRYCVMHSKARKYCELITQDAPCILYADLEYMMQDYIEISQLLSSQGQKSIPSIESDFNQSLNSQDTVQLPQLASTIDYQQSILEAKLPFSLYTTKTPLLYKAIYTHLIQENQQPALNHSLSSINIPLLCEESYKQLLSSPQLHLLLKYSSLKPSYLDWLQKYINSPMDKPSNNINKTSTVNQQNNFAQILLTNEMFLILTLIIIATPTQLLPPSLSACTPTHIDPHTLIKTLLSSHIIITLPKPCNLFTNPITSIRTLLCRIYIQLSKHFPSVRIGSDGIQHQLHDSSSPPPPSLDSPNHDNNLLFSPRFSSDTVFDLRCNRKNIKYSRHLTIHLNAQAQTLETKSLFSNIVNGDNSNDDVNNQKSAKRREKKSKDQEKRDKKDKKQTEFNPFTQPISSVDYSKSVYLAPIVDFTPLGDDNSNKAKAELLLPPPPPIYLPAAFKSCDHAKFFFDSMYNDIIEEIEQGKGTNFVGTGISDHVQINNTTFHSHICQKHQQSPLISSEHLQTLFMDTSNSHSWDIFLPLNHSHTPHFIPNIFNPSTQSNILHNDFFLHFSQQHTHSYNGNIPTNDHIDVDNYIHQNELTLHLFQQMDVKNVTLAMKSKRARLQQVQFPPPPPPCTPHSINSQQFPSGDNSSAFVIPQNSAFLCDLGVYTKNRCFRLMLSSKKKETGDIFFKTSLSSPKRLEMYDGLLSQAFNPGFFSNFKTLSQPDKTMNLTLYQLLQLRQYIISCILYMSLPLPVLSNSENSQSNKQQYVTARHLAELMLPTMITFSGALTPVHLQYSYDSDQYVSPSTNNNSDHSTHHDKSNTNSIPIAIKSYSHISNTIFSLEANSINKKSHQLSKNKPNNSNNILNKNIIIPTFQYHTSIPSKLHDIWRKIIHDTKTVLQLIGICSLHRSTTIRTPTTITVDDFWSKLTNPVQKSHLLQTRDSLNVIGTVSHNESIRADPTQKANTTTMMLRQITTALPKLFQYEIDSTFFHDISTLPDQNINTITSIQRNQLFQSLHIYLLSTLFTNTNIPTTAPNSTAQINTYQNNTYISTPWQTHLPKLITSYARSFLEKNIQNISSSESNKTTSSASEKITITIPNIHQTSSNHLLHHETIFKSTTFPSPFPLLDMLIYIHSLYELLYQVEEHMITTGLGPQKTISNTTSLPVMNSVQQKNNNTILNERLITMLSTPITMNSWSLDFKLCACNQCLGAFLQSNIPPPINHQPHNPQPSHHKHNLPVEPTTTTSQRKSNIYTQHAQRIKTTINSSHSESSPSQHIQIPPISTPNNNTNHADNYRFPPHWAISINYTIQGAMCFTLNRPHTAYSVIRRVLLTDDSLLLHNSLARIIMEHDKNDNFNKGINCSSSPSHNVQVPEQLFQKLINSITTCDKARQWLVTVSCFDHECVAFAKKNKGQQQHNKKNQDGNNNHPVNSDIKYYLSNFNYVGYE